MALTSQQLADPRLFRFDREEWRKKGRKLHRSYVGADPFPHVVIDDLLPEPVLDAVLAEFPPPDPRRWTSYSHTHTLKLACNDTELMGPATTNLIHEFNGHCFLPFLEELTGIEGLIPDPHLDGGGLHYIERGGFLGIHADFNRLSRYQLDRRINLLLYLNRDWEEAFGGHLELWNLEMTECVQRVLPVFNRCVVFSTTSTSYHGHPDPLTCPEDRGRKSLAFYYYTNGRPEEEQAEAHLTVFPGRPGEASRIPAPRAGKKKRKRRHLGRRLRDAWNALLPDP